jgi:hypothetical protein
MTTGQEFTPGLETIVPSRLNGKALLTEAIGTAAKPRDAANAIPKATLKPRIKLLLKFTPTV